MAYFDNAATTKISDEALKAYVYSSTHYWGNPSSLHKEGSKAHERLEAVRKQLSDLLGVNPSTLTFTSGATESNAIILQSLLWSSQSGDVLIPTIEHDAVSGYSHLFKSKGWNVATLDAPNGFVQPEEIRKRLNPKTRMVVCMLVNNVMGTIQNVREMVHIVRSYETQTGRKIHFHTDATQALGKIPFSLTELGVDSAAFSAHKLHGPKGVGLLYNRDAGITPLSRGGGQERGFRPGTENLAGIEAMGVAVKEALCNLDTHLSHYRALNDLARKMLSSSPHISILSPLKGCSPAILNISNDKLPSEVLSRMLYDKGYYVSSGSACSNNAKGHLGSILLAMRLSPELAKGSIRISFGTDNTEEETKGLCETLLSLMGGR